MTREKDERIAKLASTTKEFKNELLAKDQEMSAIRKQLASMQKAEDELRKQQASAASRAQKEESQSKDAIAKMRGTIEQVFLLPRDVGREKLWTLPASHTYARGDAALAHASVAPPRFRRRWRDYARRGGALLSNEFSWCGRLMAKR